MRIKKVHIKNFRSIVELSNLFLEDNLTTIVGANEHGKTNILSALMFIDPNIKFDPSKDSRLDQSQRKHPPEITYTFKLSTEDQALLGARFSTVYGSLSEEEKPINTEPIVDDTLLIYRTHKDGQDIIDSPSFENELYKREFLSFQDSIYKGKVIFFDDFKAKLISNIPLSEITNLENHIVTGLLRVSGLEEVRNQLFDKDGTVRSLIAKSSAKLTEEIKNKWFQGKRDNISFRLSRDQETQNLNLDIDDEHASTSVEARSRGFIWFISFFLNYRAYSDGEVRDCLFLLDEPGLFLHPRGQKDLLNFFELFSRYNQIVYSTHSPFMINRLKPRRVSVIEKHDGKGTQVNTRGSYFNWRALRSSLGLSLSDSFYFADKTLLVEGPEDRIYILALLKLYSEITSEKLDANLISIIDVGGNSSLPPVAKIIKAEDRPMVILIDSDSKKYRAQLDKMFQGTNTVHEVSQFKEGAITIQDLLPKELWELAVNKFIDGLVEGGTFTTSGTKKEFKIVNDNQIDKDVDGFVKSEYNEDGCSKPGIAYEFENIITDKDFDASTYDFTYAFDLVKWVIKELNLEASTDYDYLETQ